MPEGDHSLPGQQVPAEIDPAVSHSARIWDYWLGGTANYPADREVGDRIAQLLPEIVAHARANRAFLGRVVRYLAADAGIRQFLDIGAGLPTADNTHEVAQRVAPACRVVYADYDPLVVAHARALLASTAEGAADYIHGDLREPADVLASAARTLDLRQPVAITMLGVLWHVLDDDEADSIMARLAEPLAPGSYLAIAHPTLEVTGEKMARAIRYWNEHGTPAGTHRTPGQISWLFRRLELVEPGVVSATRWRPETAGSAEPAAIDQFVALGRKSL
jgi:O-methyltransferase involved in polyketide biosynthesis